MTDSEKAQPRPEDVREALLARITVSESGCWVWAGARMLSGAAYYPGWRGYLDTHPDLKRALFLERLGPERFEALELRSNQRTKRSA